MKDIKKLALEIHQGNVKRGFYEVQPTLKTQLALASSELSEAIEADRKNNYMHGLFIGTEMTPKAFEESIKDTFEDEIADTFIRLLDIVGNYDLDIYEWRSFEDYHESVYGRIDMNQSKCEILFDLQKMIYDCTESNTVDYDISIVLMVIDSLCVIWNIDLEWHIAEKLKYNETRPYKHGKEY